jgi:hypothetical protein
MLLIVEQIHMMDLKKSLKVVYWLLLLPMSLWFTDKPRYKSVPKVCVTRAIDGFTGLLDDHSKLSNTFQLGIFKMSGLFVLPF